MTAELTAADYAYLIILHAEGRLISNTEMQGIYEVRLKSPDYERLNAEGYVETTTKPRPYRHVITDKGNRAIADRLTIDQGRVKEGEKRSPGERQLFWAALVAQQKVLTRLLGKSNGAAPRIEQPAGLDSRIRTAYTKLVDAPGEWVDLAALRPLLDDVSKAELDKALTRMLDARDVRLEPDPLEHRVSAEARNAAVHIGGEDRHKLAIGRR
jgi:hypothetical protein